ncbi:hypothetical protein HJC23_000100 [Cyclotella cryptica]|uniref:DUF4214 domain-containing protein n=1 Tax=Cyclotella cryptica TaxID=29204 RepID=A0ABD3P938_9STRA
MIQIYLQTQCAVIQLLGYTPDEHGISLYTQHLSQAMQLSSPDVQEQLRTTSRDTYRTVLGGAFGMDLITEQRTKGELSIVDARNMMHKVSLRMQDDSVLEKVARACSGEGGSGVVPKDSEAGRAMELAYKHTAIQKIMVYDVYLSGSPCLVEECGFGKGEEGYVKMQGALADHQSDPLISQYVGGAMLKLLESAGIDMKNWQTPR